VIDAVVNGSGFHEWQNGVGPTPARCFGSIPIDPTAWESAVGAFVIGQCQTDLTLVAHALGAASGFPGGLDGWQQKSYEDPDNRQDNEQFH
jgi:hypothetical protein